MRDKFLESIKDTYHDDEYINVVGNHNAVVTFINNCKKLGIWIYRLYPVCVYKGRKYKGIFCKKKDAKAIKQLIAKLDVELVLNASNPFF